MAHRAPQTRPFSLRRPSRRARGLAPSALIALLALFAAACEDDSTLIALPEGADATYVYVANTASDTVSVYTVDQDTGELTASGAPVPTGNSPEGMALYPTGEYLYVSNSADDTVSVYEIDPASGALTEISGSPFAVGDNPTQLAVHPDGEWLIVANGLDVEVDSYPVDPATGAVGSLVSGDVMPSNPIEVVLHPSGDYIYASDLGGAVGSWPFDAASGVFGGGTYYTPGASDFGLAAMHPSGDYLFVSELGGDLVLTATIDSGDGTLADHANLTEPTNGGAPWGLVLDSGGNYLYASQPDIVEGFSIAGDGTIVSIGDWPKGAGSSELAMDAADRWVFAPNASDNTMSIFEIDSADGTLTEIAASPVPTGNAPRSVIVLTVVQ